jgi:hypothetical protein
MTYLKRKCVLVLGMLAGGLQAACESQSITENNSARAVIEGVVVARTGTLLGTAVVAVAYRTCSDTLVIAAGQAVVDPANGTYLLGVVGPTPVTEACVVVSALRKTSTASDSVAAPAVRLSLRPSTTAQDTARVSLSLP